MSIEAMKQALEFIEATNKGSSFWLVPASQLNKTVTSLRQAIEQAEKQEPVCPYCHDSHTLGAVYYDQNCVGCVKRMIATPQPQREWVGLTQQDIDIAFDDTQEGGGFNEFAEAIEQTLRRKNT